VFDGVFCLLANQGVRIINTSSDRFIKRDLSGKVPSKKSSDFGGRKSFTFKARTWQVIIIRNGEGIVAGASCQFSEEKERCFLHDNVPWELYSLASQRKRFSGWRPARNSFSWHFLDRPVDIGKGCAKRVAQK
jgi:hypothetical protein